MRIALIVTVLAAVAADSVRADWPQFRGPTGEGFAAATNVPVVWDASKNVRWKVAVPGLGWSSPVVADGRIYLTAATEDGPVELRALCFDLANGKPLWNTSLFRPPESETRAAHRKNSLASPTPIVSGGRVFAHFGHMGTACLDTNGTVIWRNNDIDYSPAHGNGGSPVLHQNLLIFNCDAAADPFVLALDTSNGQERWRTPRQTPARNKFSFATPLVIQADGRDQLISPASGMVASYNPADGRELWRASYGSGYSVIARPVYAHEMIYVSSSYDRPELLAVKVAGANSDVTGTHVAWTARRGAPNTPSPIVVEDELFFVSDSGIASCVDARTGNLHWTERLGGNFSASPIAAEGRLYFLNETGETTVLKAGRAFEVLSKNELGERTLASPAALNNTLLIRSSGHLWRIGQ